MRYGQSLHMLMQKAGVQQMHGVLACRIEPIIMSAGELEHEWAGTPGRLIRERYRKAAEVSRVCFSIHTSTVHSDHAVHSYNVQTVIPVLLHTATDRMYEQSMT